MKKKLLLIGLLSSTFILGACNNPQQPSQATNKKEVLEVLSLEEYKQNSNVKYSNKKMLRSGTVSSDYADKVLLTKDNTNLTLEATVRNTERYSFVDFVLHVPYLNKDVVYNEGNGEYQCATTTIKEDNEWVTKIKLETTVDYSDSYNGTFEIKDVRFLNGSSVQSAAIETVETSTLDYHVHNFKNLTNTTASTCTTPGFNTYTCECELNDVVSLDLIEHNWNAGVVTTQPTCTSTGVKTYTCQDCQTTKTETLQALGHNYETQFTVDLQPTCQQVGLKSKHCTRCDSKSEVTTITELGHTYDEGTVTVNSTCTTTGTKKFNCERCDHSYTEDVTELGHTYDEGVVTTQPTCQATGSKLYTCTRDNEHTYTETLNKVDHNFVNGNCSVCNASEGLSFTLKSDDTYELTGLGTCTSSNVIIPDTYNCKPVTSLANRALYNTQNIVELTIPASITSIGNQALLGCMAQTIYYNCTVGCVNNVSPLPVNTVKKVVFGPMDKIPNNILTNSRELTEVVISEGTRSIGSYSFANSEKLTTVSLPEGLDYTGWYAFTNCLKIEYLNIPSTVTNIENSFRGLRGLKVLVFPVGLTVVKDQALWELDSIEKVYYTGDQIEWSGIQMGNELDQATIYYLSETQPTQTGNYWHYVNNQIVEW